MRAGAQECQVDLHQESLFVQLLLGQKLLELHQRHLTMEFVRAAMGRCDATLDPPALGRRH